ncbi:hypothetical protein [Amycolatopsis sp. EV170708-02-1]|uniref:hypothetical protein n=1 Tax=Amycolatopsis sp. EV170708-02-1 TaxID=2919322 RepID=UPI001F0C9B82|nr:hypothetical protein [Amycolatopsis sp. EV170708-02-1]UMP00026.1 hypothetical protein MJQ72_26350 [Amycolatopsis sp. EV170708-02-1]
MTNIRVPVAAIGMAAAAVLGASAPAVAVPAAPIPWPENCTDAQNGNGWTAQCTSGTGRYKATVICTPLGGGPDVFREPGSWTAIGEASYVFCPPLTSVRDGGILSTGT